MEQNVDFTIQPFKLGKQGPRSDKGESHNYPKARTSWNLMCHGHSNSNLSFNQTNANVTIMDIPRVFKHSAELREYWRLVKRKQRAQAKKKEHEING
jgi:hypothetical protein